MKNIHNNMKSTLLKTAACLLVFTIQSCDSFVEIPASNSQLTGISVFSDNTTATAAMKDIYAKMRDTGLLSGRSTALSNLLGQYTDELICYQTGITTAEPFYSNVLNSTNAPVQDIWNATYSQIYAANAVLEGVKSSSALSTTQKNQLIGEALFIRALLHSYLAGLFGDCPYIATTDYEKNRSVPRLPKSQVFTQCINDLLQAEGLLLPEFVGENRTRPNQFAVKALLARIYLYNSQWAEAANAASSVLNQTSTYTLEPDLNKVFLKESKTTIWQFATGGAVKNTQEGALFIFTAGPPPTVALSPNLYSSFEEGDLRKTAWIKAVTTGGTTWYHAYKYKQDGGATASKEYSIVLRLGEQYLIRAEARARQGDLINAKEDLNFIRNRAGLPNTTSINNTDVLEAIVKERRWELFTEFGHRFFDLQRNLKLDETLTIVKPGWNTTDRLWPIPESELLINPNLEPQNEGY